MRRTVGAPRTAACVLAALTAAILTTAGTPASAAIDEPVRAALALHAAGKPASAYAKLAPLVRARAGDPDFDYAFGLAAADSGHRGDAIIALQRVIVLQPGNGPARAEIARVYALSGDIDTAKATFDTVVNDPSVPDPVRQRLDRLVRGYDRQIRGGGSEVSGFVDAEVGYDSNINTATGLTSITLPVFAFLGPATRTRDGYGQVQAGLSASTGLSRQTKLHGSLVGTTRDNFGGSAFSQDSLTPTVGVSYTTASRDVIAVSGQAQLFWLGRNAYRTSYGAIGQHTHRLAGGRALFVSGQYFRLDYKQDNLRDADRFAGTVGYAGKYVVATVGGGREVVVNAAAPQLSFGFASGAVSGEVPLSDRVAVVGGASVEYRDYDATDPPWAAALSFLK